jgi:hypothetical protein
MRLLAITIGLTLCGQLLVPALRPSLCLADDSTKAPSTKSAVVNAPINEPPAPKLPVKPLAKPAAARPAPLSAEREADALAFAREQHPELAKLIEKLRKDNRRQFDRAIRELAQDHDRLVRLKKQSPPQYDLALAAWKLDSRAHLLAARMTMSHDPALEVELKQVLRERVDVRLKQLQFERGRLQERLSVVNKSIEKIQANEQAVADAELERIKLSIAKNRRPAPRKPAPNETRPARPVIAERPRVPAEKSAASVTAPGPHSSQNKAKQD